MSESGGASVVGSGAGSPRTFFGLRVAIPTRVGHTIHMTNRTTHQQHGDDFYIYADGVLVAIAELARLRTGDTYRMSSGFGYAKNLDAAIAKVEKSLTS